MFDFFSVGIIMVIYDIFFFFLRSAYTCSSWLWLHMAHMKSINNLTQSEFIYVAKECGRQNNVPPFLQDVCVLIPKPCGYVTLQCKKEGDEIKNLVMGRLYWIIHVGSINHMFHKRRVGEWVREMPHEKNSTQPTIAGFEDGGTEPWAKEFSHL